MWLPLQYIALSAHKSSDAIVINILNKVHPEKKEWRRKEKYGGKSRRMDVTFWRMKRRLNPKKHIGEKGDQWRKRKLKMNKALEPGKDLE